MRRRKIFPLPFLSAITSPGDAYMVSMRANILRAQLAAMSWRDRGARVNSIRARCDQVKAPRRSGREGPKQEILPVPCLPGVPYPFAEMGDPPCFSLVTGRIA